MENIFPASQIPEPGIENLSWNLEPISPAITIPNNGEKPFCFFDIKKYFLFSNQLKNLLV